MFHDVDKVYHENNSNLVKKKNMCSKIYENTCDVLKL